MTTPLPSIPNFLAGAAYQQGDMTGLFTTPMNFFMTRQILRVHQASASTTLPSAGTMTTIAFDTVDVDNYSGWNAGTHAFSPPTGLSGWFLVTSQVFIASPAAAGTGLGVQIVSPVLTTSSSAITALANNKMPTSGTASAGSTSVMAYVYLVGGSDTVLTQACVTNAGANATTNLSNGLWSTMDVSWVMG